MFYAFWDLKLPEKTAIPGSLQKLCGQAVAILQGISNFFRL
jgi:hypothetical protein